MRLFDVATAEKLIPFLQRTFAATRAELQEIETLERAIAQADQEASGQGREGTAGVKARLQTEKASRTAAVLASLKEVEDLGILVKAADGLVDFHAQREGRTVLLCWRYGETAIAHWHELDEGFAGRTAIVDRAEFETAYLS